MWGNLVKRLKYGEDISKLGKGNIIRCLHDFLSIQNILDFYNYNMCFKIIYVKLNFILKKFYFL